MNLVSNRVSLWLATWLMLVACAPLPAEISLHPIYTSDMVLQQGEDNIIYGFATPSATVTGFFRGKKFRSVKVKANGEWELNLPKSNLREASPATLEFVEENRDRQLDKVELTNVVVGRVWWLGVNGAGLPAGPRAISAFPGTARDRIRFVDLDNGSWISLARQGETTNRIHAFSLVAAHNLLTTRNLLATNAYVGIIQTSPGTIEEFGGKKSLGRDSSGVLAEINGWLNEARDGVNRAYVSVERSNNRQLLITAKHSGVVTNLVPPVFYGLSKVRLRDEFSPANASLKEFLRRYTFEGAIW